MLDSKVSVTSMPKPSLSPRNRRFWLPILTAFAIGATAASGPSAPLQGVVLAASASVAQNGAAAADRMQQKLEAIVRFGAIPRLETQSTVIEEGEVNAYLEHSLRAEIPPGISPPVLRILADNRLSATATLDLDVMNASRPPGEGFDPLRVLRGSLPAKVTGRLITENGSGRFELESAELGGIPLPRVLVSQLVSRYSVSPDEPNGIDIDAPFDLPSSIREIRVEPGQVTVLQ
jgi:hypothetical protein